MLQSMDTARTPKKRCPMAAVAGSAERAKVERLLLPKRRRKWHLAAHPLSRQLRRPRHRPPIRIAPSCLGSRTKNLPCRSIWTVAISLPGRPPPTHPSRTSSCLLGTHLHRTFAYADTSSTFLAPLWRARTSTSPLRPRASTSTRATTTTSTLPHE